MTIDTSDRREQRKFGLVMAVAICVLGLIRWWWHGCGPLPMGFFYVAAEFAGVGIILPKALQPVFWAWMKFALAVNVFMNGLLLSLAFFLLIVPTRVILRLRGKDPLNRSWDPEAPSYWEDPEEQPEDPRQYFHPF